MGSLSNQALWEIPCPIQYWNRFTRFQETQCGIITLPKPMLMKMTHGQAFYPQQRLKSARQLIEYRIVDGTRVLYDQTRLSLGLDSISLNVQRTLKLSIQNEKNVVLNEKSVEGKPCINRESKSNELTIYLYSCQDINMKFIVVATPPSIYHG